MNFATAPSIARSHPAGAPIPISVALLLALSLALGIALLWGMTVAQPAASAAESATLAAQRAEDPVEVAGGSLPGLDGVPIAELAVYGFDGSAWAPIPFQIDEVDASGVYTSTEDGLMDSNDVLVFMARDLGQGAPPTQWPADSQARSHARHAILAQDSLSGATGMVYVYRSTTLARSATRYVTWDQNAQTLTTPAFAASFDPANFIGLANLSLHGGPDVLDRQKIRIRGKVGGILPFTLNENQIPGTVGIPATIELTVQGPIRALRSGSALNVAFYRERFAFETVLNTADFTQFGTLDSLRTSLDLNDPAGSGLTRFFDSNGTDAAIDGNPDNVAGTPLFRWYQVSGHGAGPGGMVVAFPNLNLGTGSAVNYYLDNGAANNDDTGDQKSYADTGLTVTNPGGRTAITLAGMILPQGTAANVGQSIFDRTVTPITVTVTAAPYLDPATAQEIFLPSVLR